MEEKPVVVLLALCAALVSALPAAAATRFEGPGLVAAGPCDGERSKATDDGAASEAQRIEFQVRRRVREQRHGRPYGIGYEARREAVERSERADRPERPEHTQRPERLERGTHGR